MHAGVGERPRELRWYHAAGMLFGDWGTSRLYVLGLAFTMLRHERSPHASFWYVAAMCVLVTLVGFCYAIICRHFPDGGGVYSAARQRSKTLAVLGSLLLIADYIVTASLSSYEAFRYLLPSDWTASTALYLGAGSIVAIGAMNIFGPKRVGTLATIIAVIAGVFYLILAAACVPHLSDAKISAPSEPPGVQWQHFIDVVLALSGVEAIANMTGVMAEPVGKNSSKAIFAVLLEVVILNIVMALAMNALPIEDLGAGKGFTIAGFAQDDVKDHMLKVLAIQFVSKSFAAVSAVFFGLLLLSAANSAIGGMVSIQYLMSRDRELPSAFTALNHFGMPKWGLVVATVAPALLLVVVGAHTDDLANLYAIGVVGAITINLLACASNKELDLAKWERVVLFVIGAIIAAIEISIAYDKPNALVFAAVVVGVGLTGRLLAKLEWRSVAVSAASMGAAGVAYWLIPFSMEDGKIVVSHLQSFSVAGLILGGVTIASMLVRPETIRLEEEREAEGKKKKAQPFESAVRAAISASAPRILVPTRGSPKLIKFAASYAKDKKAVLFVLFVREVALAFRERSASLAPETMTLANDKEAQKIFADARKVCDDMGVAMQPLYSVYDSAAELILDHAATLGVDAVLMGVSQRGALWKTLRGDVLQEVIGHLPESIPLLIHA